jgi:hypothetical protein
MELRMQLGYKVRINLATNKNSPQAFEGRKSRPFGSLLTAV